MGTIVSYIDWLESSILRPWRNNGAFGEYGGKRCVKTWLDGRGVYGRSGGGRGKIAIVSAYQRMLGEKG